MLELKDLLLHPARLSLAVAESVTCGRVQARVGSIPGASTFFLGGITAYSIDAKVAQLGVDRAAAEAVNCVSQEIAEQMAVGACELFSSDLGVATTGYAEPDPSRSIKDPFAWWALARRLGDGRLEVQSALVECPGQARTAAQDIFSITALNGLVRYLQQLRASGRDL